MDVLKRLLRFVRPYWKTLILVNVLMLVRTGLSLLPPLVQRRVVDQVIARRDAAALTYLIGGLLLIHLLVHTVDIGDLYYRQIIGERFIVDLRVRIYDHLQQLSLAFHEESSTGELMSRVTNDVNSLEMFVTHGVSLALVALLRLLGASAILLILSWRLALVMLAFLPLVAAGLWVYNHRTRPIHRRVHDRLGDINSGLQDKLTGMHLAQAFKREADELEQFRELSRTYLTERVAVIRTWSVFLPAIRFASILGSAFVLGFGARMVIRGQITLGTLVAFLSYIASFYEPLRRLTEIDITIQGAIASGERIFELLDTESRIQDAPDARCLDAISGDVKFDNVHFRYGEGAKVLKDLTFGIAPGEVVALAGPSGAGKTSIAKLLCRFHDPEAGRILVDGQDIRELQIHSLRQHISVVL